MKSSYKYLLPKTCYKKTIRKYNPGIRIFSTFLEFIDHTIFVQNTDVLEKLFQLKKNKTLTERDIAMFHSLVRMYTPRKNYPLEEKRVLNLKSRIKKLYSKSNTGVKLRVSSKGWLLLSDIIYQKIEHISLLIEKYIILTKRTSLSHKDIPLLFTTHVDFLL